MNSQPSGLRSKPLSLAIMGTRGIPANYGGFETFAEELSTRLVAHGHRVTVYGRSHYVDPSRTVYRGVRLVVLPAIQTKYWDTLSHTFLSSLHGCWHRHDVVLICNAANAIFALPLRMTGQRVVVNVDGVERRRAKWNRLGRIYYRLSEYLSTRGPHAMVTDARAIERYYLETYGADSVFIPYGARAEPVRTQDALVRFGLSAGQYVLYVSRLEPENNAHVVIAAFESVRTDCRLVMVGDAPYSRSYIAGLRRTRDPRILFTGAVYGQGYWELLANAACYVQATEVGGTHPALIEAMAQGNLVIANGTPENAEVVGDAGLLYRRNDASDLAAKLQAVLDAPDRHAAYRARARARAQQCYSWEVVVDRYERLFYDLLEKS